MIRLSLTPALGILFAVTAGGFIATSPSFAQIGNPNTSSQSEPILVELFTSQGCSSCPPADRLAQKLNKQSNLVVISRPVTYWDRLGWKDTLASEANTDLQRAYARKTLGGRNGVYTPQMVVNGRFGVVGSQENPLRGHINRASQNLTSALRIKTIKDGSVAVGMAGPENAKGELVLVAIDSIATVAIGRGENSGRNIHYTNVVRSEKVVGKWNGGEQGVLINSAQMAAQKSTGVDRYALILREAKAGTVLASSWIS